MLVFVGGGVFDASLEHSLTSLDAGATLATLHISAFVAAPGLGVVDAECLAMAGDLALTYIGIGRCDLDAIARTGCDSLRASGG